MKNSAKGRRELYRRLRPVLRALIAFVLVAFLGLEILPLGFVEFLPAPPGGPGERTACLEPLQVCDCGDTFLGVLSDLPVLLPGAFCLLPSSAALPVVQEAVAFVPDGYRPAIDHPPQLPA